MQTRSTCVAAKFSAGIIASVDLQKGLPWIVSWHVQPQSSVRSSVHVITAVISRTNEKRMRRFTSVRRYGKQAERNPSCSLQIQTA